ncbi:MFS transporter [Agrococcus sp. HG114]|uniref:MFS transporter n=1 Tax=Agrococcus sp. HG114 TaxID=2969757 RepID=UPI00215B2B45|nr:MFS transporter [Agrococcus sp. HG114]MCR8670046.1 MFS transporter [Agrococcus sp. HG114]
MGTDARVAASLGSARRLAALAAGQVISWGILYYGPLVAAPAIAAGTGWSLAEVTLSLSAGLVASAAAGIAVGRWLDRRGPRVLMTVGSLVGGVGMVVASTASTLPHFALGWAIAGVGQAAVLYQAAFTVIVKRHPHDRRRAMTIVTLAGGLASTVFAPITAGLLSAFDWRSVLCILAAVLVATTTPLHWSTLERSWPSAAAAVDAPRPVGAVLRSRRFWLLELAMVGIAAALYSVTLALIPLLTEKGVSFELAAWALGLLGAGQVIGRLVHAVTPHAAAAWVPLLVVAGASALLLAALALVPGPPWVLILIGIATGAARGAQTLVQGSAVVERWGAASYGALNGVFAAPITAVAALGPALGPVLALGTGSYAGMALIAAGVAAAAAVVARWT